MSRKTGSFGQLIAYINATEHAGPSILQNLRTDCADPIAIEREFLDNSHYLPPRKNGNMLFHEILSFSDVDRDRTPPAILEDLARKYLELRAPYALAYGRSHLDTDCPHVHLMISANNVRSSRPLRLSRSRFAAIKRDLEAYQRERYPFLEASVVSANREESPRRAAKLPSPRWRAESERARRQKKQAQKTPSQKEIIRDTILQQLTAAASGEAFFLRLKLCGLRLYRRGQTVSVEDLSGGRRYRLRTLGLEEAFKRALRQWRVLPERLETIQRADLGRAQQFWRKLGFREEIRDLLKLNTEDLTASQRERFAQSRRQLTAKRAHSYVL